MKERRKNTADRRKSMRDIFADHAESDRDNFKKISDSLELIEGHMKTSNEFMKNLSWLNDITRGSSLLKKPSLWVLAFVVGVVALMGGFKVIVAGILRWVALK